MPAEDGLAVRFACADGIVLGGHLWCPANDAIGRVIVNPATGVLARYYHRYARFLAAHGFEVLTYDYRGIGASRPDDLRACGYRWHHWGVRDFEAALRFFDTRRGNGPLAVVGHSFGGVIPGLARSASEIDRVLTVGAQYAWLGDYAPRHRLALIAKWHVVMPLVTVLYGYFPGRRLGWLEDLPAGVANEWSFRGPRFESSLPRGERRELVARMAGLEAPILAVVVSDDELGTEPAIRRTLGYYAGARRSIVLLRPADYGRASIGHFSLFRQEHADGFWMETLAWLGAGVNPWPSRVIGKPMPGFT